MRVEIFDHSDGLKRVPFNVLSKLTDGLVDAECILAQASLTELRQRVEDILAQAGFSGQVAIDNTSGISITGMRETVGVCFQTGNVARMYADLLKLQVLFVRGTISSAVFLVLLKRTGTVFGSNLASWERLTKELNIFEDVITVPMIVVGIGAEQ